MSGHPVPTMRRATALLFLGPAALTLTAAMDLADGSGWWLVLVLVVGWPAAVLSYLDGQRWTVTLDGTTVELRGRFTRARFDLDDITSVIEPVLETRGPLRVDGAERRVLDRRLPRVVPWPQLVTTSVHPSFWVRHAGVPEAKVRGGGLTALRRGLR